MNLQESGDFRADDRVMVVMRIDSGEKKIRASVKKKVCGT